MAVNGAISKTTFTETTVSYTSKIRPVHITELRTAIDRLQSYAANVDNCGNCTYCQTCQSATCQSAVCQSQSCQSLSCQSCQSYSCQSMAGCYGAEAHSGYNTDFGDYPPTQDQIDGVAKVVAVLCEELDLPIDYAHDMEKWNLFKFYNKRDVEVEMSIQDRLKKYPVPDFVWDEYHLDQEINDRGISLDMDVVENAIAFDAKSKAELAEKMQELTDLDNPNSVVQMKQWLADNGLEMDSLGKKEVAQAVKTAPKELTEVLLLRQQLSKSSVKKYQAMQNAVCEDGRARGMFQFYGANRSGRWAGRMIQLQNLPQNHMPDLEQARGLVESGNYDAIELLYDDIPDTLSQLIRTAFVPKDGNKFIVADFSAIEARVLSWHPLHSKKVRAFHKTLNSDFSTDTNKARCRSTTSVLWVTQKMKMAT